TLKEKSPPICGGDFSFRVQLRRVNASSPAIINARLQGAAGHFLNKNPIFKTDVPILAARYLLP
uniref:hypothetical protein n=1 Tax=Gemmiger sp. TaxID=2049027 RepID=UPI003FF13A93